MAGAVEFLRNAEWLDAARVRGYAVLIGIASLALLVVSWFQAQGPDASDFLAFWGSAKAVLAGMPQAAYDLHWQQQVQTGAGFTGWYAFVNPPPFLFVTAPFGFFGGPQVASSGATYAPATGTGTYSYESHVPPQPGAVGYCDLISGNRVCF